MGAKYFLLPRFTRRDGRWTVAGSLEILVPAASERTPVEVTKRDGEVVTVVITGEVIEEKGGFGYASEFVNVTLIDQPKDVPDAHHDDPDRDDRADRRGSD